MFAVVIALIILAVAVGVIYLLLKNMGEDGIEVAAPGSCKSGRCGVRCAAVSDARDDQAVVGGNEVDQVDEIQRKDSA